MFYSRLTQCIQGRAQQSCKRNAPNCLNGMSASHMGELWRTSNGFPRESLLVVILWQYYTKIARIIYLGRQRIFAQKEADCITKEVGHSYCTG